MRELVKVVQEKELCGYPKIWCDFLNLFLSWLQPVHLVSGRHILGIISYKRENSEASGRK